MHKLTTSKRVAFVLCLAAGALALGAGGTTGCGGDNGGTPTNQNDAAMEAAPPPVDSGPTCVAPLTQCGPECTDTKTDPTNCGACGTKCDTAMAKVCSNGACALACAPGESNCNSACVDEKNDPQNCGMCGKTCNTRSGEVCSGGVCVFACLGGTKACPGEAGIVCADEQNDPNHCGSCTTVCNVAGGERCVAGVCTTTCVLGSIKCTSDAGVVCVDPQTDNQNCGMCNNPCGPGYVCSNGMCGLTCAPPTVVCGGATPTDAGAGEGGPGDAAPDGSGDAGGGDASSDGGVTQPYCADLQTDPNNCGMCGRACPPGIACIGGKCPTLVPGSTGCTTVNADTGRKAAVDATNNTLYAGMICGGGVPGKGSISISTDGGNTFTTPAVIPGLGATFEFAIATGPANVVYAAGVQPGALIFNVSSDGGKTWGTPQTLDTQPAGPDVSIATFKSSVYVLIQSNGGYHLYRNANAGQGPFLMTTITPTQVFWDTLVDTGTGDVWIGGDTPTPNVAKSTDQGATFGPFTAINGAQTAYSDWTLGGGNIYVTGITLGNPAPPNLYAISTANPTTATPITGIMASVNPQAFAVSADVAGNVYLSLADTTGAIDLVHVVKGTTVVESTRTLAATGGSAPSVAAGPNNDALVVFTHNGAVLTSLQSY